MPLAVCNASAYRTSEFTIVTDFEESGDAGLLDDGTGSASHELNAGLPVVKTAEVRWFAANDGSADALLSSEDLEKRLNIGLAPPRPVGLLHGPFVLITTSSHVMCLRVPGVLQDGGDVGSRGARDGETAIAVAVWAIPMRRLLSAALLPRRSGHNQMAFTYFTNDNTRTRRRRQKIVSVQEPEQAFWVVQTAVQARILKWRKKAAKARAAAVTRAQQKEERKAEVGGISSLLAATM